MSKCRQLRDDILVQSDFRVTARRRSTVSASGNW